MLRGVDRRLLGGHAGSRLGGGPIGRRRASQKRRIGYVAGIRDPKRLGVQWTFAAGITATGKETQPRGGTPAWADG